MKEIYFCVNTDTYVKTWMNLDEPSCCPSYEETEKAIGLDSKIIVTTSLAHLSFDLLDNYDVYLCKGDKKVKIEIGMPLSNKGMTDILHQGYDEELFDWFLTDWFEELLN